MIKRIGFTVLAVLALSIAAQAADSFVGKWEWNKAKSKFSGPGELVAATILGGSTTGRWQNSKLDAPV